MIKNHLKTAWRSIWNTKSYAIVNILGLSAGLASFIIVLLYLNYELSYDKWSLELERVYRIGMNTQEDIDYYTPAPLASLLAEKDPNIIAATAIQASDGYEALVSTDLKNIYQDGFVVADSNFLKVFPYKLLQGNPRSALKIPGSVIINSELSLKLFGDDDPIGKRIKIYNAEELTVSGVFSTPETPTHFSASLVYLDPYFDENNHWENYSYSTYIKLKNQASEANISSKINKNYFEERLSTNGIIYEDYQRQSGSTRLFVDAVPQIHNFPKYGSSNFTTVTVLFILSVLLLVVGSINFSNLSLAKSLSKTKEIGIRKVLGSGTWNLFWRFIIEAFLQCAISLSLALILVYLSIPYVNSFLNLNLRITLESAFIAQILGCLLLIVMVSGLFPALLLSRFRLLNVLQNAIPKGTYGVNFRNALVVFQFVITGSFIIAIVVINEQLHFMQQKDKGFSEEQVVRIEATQQTRDRNFPEVQTRLLKIPGVQSVSKSTTIPGDTFVDSATIAFRFNADEYRMNSVKVSTDYFKTINARLVKGRTFNASGRDQHTQSAVINRSAAALLGKDQLLGQSLYFPYCEDNPIQIVGIIEDFNVMSYERIVQPAVFTIGNEACMFQSGGALLAKLNTKTPQQTLKNLENIWKIIEPGNPLRYSFLDENFQRLFQSYYRLQKVINFFGLVALLISVTGLFSLTTFVLRQRIKEIGIRRILGADLGHIIGLVNKDFMILVGIATFIAVPIGWYAMNEWLQGFAYKITLGWKIFAISTAAILCIAFLTVSLKTIKTVLQNPVDSLRNE